MKRTSSRRRNSHQRKTVPDKSILWLQLYRSLKVLSAYPHWMRKNIRDQVAFECYLKGRHVPKRIDALFDEIAAGCPSFKFNPYHDELGRFTFAPGGPATDDNEDDDNSDSGNQSNDTGDEDSNTPSANPSSTAEPLPKPSLNGDTQVADASGQTGSAPANEYPTSSITSLDDAHQLIANSNGQYIGKNNQCASLTHALAPELPAASAWLPGDQVQGDLNIPLGTPIATFNFQNEQGTNGYGPPDNQGGISGQSHTGIYLGQDSTGLSLLSQWATSSGPQIRHIPWTAWGVNIFEGGSRYYTIDY